MAYKSSIPSCLILSCLAFLCALLAENTLSAQPPQTLSPPGTNAHSPQVAALPSGNCAIAWIARGNNETIMLRRRENGNWLAPEEIFHVNAPQTLSEISITYSSPQNLYLTWSLKDTTHNNKLMLTRAGLGIPVPPHPIVQSQKHLEHASIMVAPQGTLLIAWQERLGSESTIRCRVTLPDGNVLQQTPHSPKAGYNRYPKWIHLPDGTPALCWYALSSDSTQLLYRPWLTKEATFGPQKKHNWPTQLLADLPLAGGASQTGLFLAGHRTFGTLNQIFIHTQKIGLALPDESPLYHDRFPVIAKPKNDFWAIVWQRETPTGTLLMQAAIRQNTSQAIPLAQIDPFLFPQPSVAVTANSVIAVWRNYPSKEQTNVALHFQEYFPKTDQYIPLYTLTEKKP